MGTTVANFQAEGYCAVEIIKLKCRLNGIVRGSQRNLRKRFGRLRRPVVKLVMYEILRSTPALV